MASAKDNPDRDLESEIVAVPVRSKRNLWSLSRKKILSLSTDVTDDDGESVVLRREAHPDDGQPRRSSSSGDHSKITRRISSQQLRDDVKQGEIISHF